MANSALSVANLNFNDIKTNLQNYMQTQSSLKDYDFTGSNINVLLDVLSYNTYMQNFYLNMVANESFLNSAVLRDSIVSHAKTLNYLPQSRSSSTSTIKLKITPEDVPAAITIPKYTSFTSAIDGKSYTFSTNEGITISSDAVGNYEANNISLFEGEIVTELFTVNSSNTNQRFVLNNKEIDTDSLVVKVIQSATDTANAEWTRNLNTIGIDGNSNTFFIAPAESGKYEVQFGDGILGKKLENNNIVQATYRKSSGEAPDSANVFTLVGDIQGYSNVLITSLSKARGGSLPESDESIRKNASRSLTIQDRTVTVNDYKSLIKQNFNDVQAINVYGGEESIPPQFGKVIISIDLKNAEGIPLSRKRDIEAFVKLRAPLSITPVVVDPEFLYVDIKSSVRYNPNVTTKSDNELQTVVINAIKTHTSANIDDFDTKLRLSKLSADIDLSDPSILNNDTSVTLEKRIVPQLNKSQTFLLQYDNAFYREIPINGIFVDGTAPISSSTFTFNGLTGCSFRDDGSGVLQIIQDTTTGVEIVEPSIGTVDYTLGLVNINSFKTSLFTGNAIRLFATPTSRTISSTKNIVLTYNASPTIQIVQERS
mgnify:CR=1 FL=1|tara:strand:+ start:5491 stop:7281 length:1791 start_codon:yes stop_codon:yes gene_type:complete